MLKIKDLKAGIEDNQILNGINLEVNAGEVHAIMGPNGSGKSTLAAVIAGKDEYTLNAALVIDTVPVLGLVGAPKKNRLFYSYSPNESYLIESSETKKINCKKQQPKGKIVALSSSIKPSDIILNKLKEFKVNEIVKMASSYKFCVIATGEYDIYAARERANEWDYAAGHAVAQNAGAIIKTLDEKPFLYGKGDYKNPSLLMKRSVNLND